MHFHELLSLFCDKKPPKLQKHKLIKKKKKKKYLHLLSWSCRIMFLFNLHILATNAGKSQGVSWVKSMKGMTETVSQLFFQFDVSSVDKRLVILGSQGATFCFLSNFPWQQITCTIFCIIMIKSGQSVFKVTEWCMIVSGTADFTCLYKHKHS